MREEGHVQVSLSARGVVSLYRFPNLALDLFYALSCIDRGPLGIPIGRCSHVLLDQTKTLAHFSLQLFLLVSLFAISTSFLGFFG